MVDRGLVCIIDKDTKKLIMEYFNSISDIVRYTLVYKTGWKNSSYIMQDRVINNDSHKNYLLVPSYRNDHFLEKHGSLEQWKELTKYCRNNSRIVTALCAGFAAPLLTIAGINSCGIHFFGNSSIGKSTVQIIANSIYRSKKGIYTWRGTDNGIETIASLNSDSLLILDEISQASEKIISNTVYMLGNGVGKSRATKNIELVKPKMWNLLFISSGEESLKTMIEKNSVKVNAGLEVRLIDIPANTNSGMGIFEDIHGFDSSAKFLNNINSIAINNYGYAGEVYLEYVANHYDKIKSEISKYLDAYTKSCTEIKGSTQLQRIAAVFGIMCYAGKIACEAGLMNLDTDEINEAINVCFNDFLSNEVVQVIAKRVKLYHM